MKTILMVLAALALALSAFAAGEKEKSAAATAAQPAPLKVAIFDRGNIPAENGSAADNVWTKWIQAEMLKNYNISLTLVGIPRAQERDKLNTLMASGDAPDIIMTYYMDLFFSYATQGGLTDTTDLLRLYGANLVKFLGPGALKYGQLGGKQLMIPAKRAFQGIFADYIRKDWLDKLSLPMPTTTEQWYQAVKTIKQKDPGMIGSDKITGVFLDKVSHYRLGASYSSNLLRSFVTPMTEEESYILPDLKKPGYKDGVRLLNKMYNEGLINPEFALATTADKFYEGVANGTIASVTTAWWDLFGKDAVKALLVKVPDADYRAGTFFRNSQGKYVREIYAPTDMLLMIPKFSKSSVAAVKYLDWLAKEETGNMLWNGVEGVHHTLKDSIPVLIPKEQWGEAAKKMPWLNSWDMSIVRRGNIFADTPAETDRYIASTLLGLRQEGRNQEGDMRFRAAQVSLVDGFTPPFFGKAIVSEGKYGSILIDKHEEVVIKSIMAKPDAFDAVFDGLLDEFMKAGAQQIIDEKREAFRTLGK